MAANAAVVYKWTDADGVVHFSDQPVPGAEKIIVATSTANGIGRANAPGMPAVRNAPEPHPQQTVSIASPNKEQVFFNDDVVSVRLEVNPGLQANQALTWALNGTPLTAQGPDALAFALPGRLARGTYTLSATVTDAATGQSQAADSVTFYVKQPSELDPLRRR